MSEAKNGPDRRLGGTGDSNRRERACSQADCKIKPSSYRPP